MPDEANTFTRPEGMRKLKTLLHDEKFNTEEGLRKYIDQHYGKKSKIPFTIYRAEDLRLDSEQRIYGYSLIYKRVIFDIKSIVIRNSDEISFDDCIFLGDVSIGSNKVSSPIIYIDSCIFKGSLQINSIDLSNSIYIESINCPNLFISGINTDKLSVCNSNIGTFTIINSSITIFFTFCNQIKYLEVDENYFGKVDFPSSQLPIYELSSSNDEALVTKIKDEFKFLEFTPEIDFEELSNKSHQAARNHTFKFILEHSDVKLDRNSYAHIRYLETITGEHSQLSLVLFRLTGALLKPERIIYIMLFVMFIFTFIQIVVLIFVKYYIFYYVPLVAYNTYYEY